MIYFRKKCHINERILIMQLFYVLANSYYGVELLIVLNTPQSSNEYEGWF